MSAQPIEPIRATYPTLSPKQTIIVYSASILTMSIGWLLAAYIPLWLAPPDENLGKLFLLYFLIPCLIWGVVPFLLFRYWKLPINADAWFNWIVRYILLFVVWMIVFLLVFSRGYEDNVYFQLAFSVLSRTTCTSETTENGNIVYTCKGGLSASSTCSDEDQISINSGFDAVGFGCPYQYTFEGREGLPFVWYTGEIIPTPEVEND